MEKILNRKIRSIWDIVDKSKLDYCKKKYPNKVFTFAIDHLEIIHDDLVAVFMQDVLNQDKYGSLITKEAIDLAGIFNYCLNWSLTKRSEFWSHVYYIAREANFDYDSYSPVELIEEDGEY